MLESLYEYHQISHLNKQEQQSLIQKAKYEAFTTLGLTGKAVAYLMLNITSSAALVLILPRFVSSTLTYLIAVSSFVVCYQFSSKSLISQGLKSILAKQPIANHTPVSPEQH